MFPFLKNQYQTCSKCQHQSEIPQTGDLLYGIWNECPKCGSDDWELQTKKSLLKNLVKKLAK